jgi:hypothetical protein
MIKTNIDKQIYIAKYCSSTDAYKLFQGEEAKADYD